MFSGNADNIVATIAKLHEDDMRQLEVIFSDKPRLIVEAPAGYGKTTTMVSRIAYLISTESIPNPKRILVLTFNVNAALKVKRDVADKLPTLLNMQNNPVVLSEKVTVTNYHGFCKGILRKFGYLISDALRKDINSFKALGKIRNNKGSTASDWLPIVQTLSFAEQETVNNIDASIENGCMPCEKDLQPYFTIMLKLLPLNFITHNAVILFVLDLFKRFPEINKFYQNYYQLVIVDEFQDTNCIAWELLDSIIVTRRTQLLFLGDPLQRIYGFIGALPNIMGMAANEYYMEPILLEKNYRFRNNPEMLKLDKNIRANAASIFTPLIAPESIAQVPAFWGATQQEEASKIVTKIQSLISDGMNRVTILFRARGINAEVVEDELLANEVPYFYGMFTDEDQEYVDFHIVCQDLFIKRFGKSKFITLKSLQVFTESVRKKYVSEAGKTIDSLLRLLDALVTKVSIDYATLQPEEKFDLLLDIFENRQIKQAMEYVDSQVILSTVHGAKGLEWDYVILADLERWVFPGFICSNCASRSSSGVKCCCRLPNPLPTDMKEKATDELSVFYVGITRAKKQAFVSASAKRYNADRREMDSMFSCFASIEGIRLVRAL